MRDWNPFDRRRVPATGPALCWTLLSVMLFSGCGTTGTTELPSDAKGPALSHDGEPWPKVSPVEVLPDHDLAGRYAIVKNGEATTAAFTLKRIEPGVWTLDIEGHQTARWELDEEGALRLPWQTSVDQGVRVEYEPALVLLPPKGTGVSRTEAEMTVYHLDSGKQETAGECVYVVSPGGPGVFEPTLERPMALYSSSVRRIDVPLAEATVRAEVAYAIGEGAIATDLTRVLRPMGLFASTSETTFRVIEIGPIPSGDEEAGTNDAPDSIAPASTTR
ncbi:MAG: hypothetical protein ACOC3G_03330 [Phycisphaeraceae bacterium]